MNTRAVVMCGGVAMAITMHSCGERSNDAVPHERADADTEAIGQSAPVSDAADPQSKAEQQIDSAPEPFEIAPGLMATDAVRGDGDAVGEADRVLVTIEMRAAGAERGVTAADIETSPSDPNLIEGLRRGLIGMRPGGERRLTIAAPLGYGEAGREPVIPPGADIEATIRLIRVLGGE